VAIFLTGVTGYLGSYVADELLRRTDERLSVLIRADSIQAARERLWKSLQLHMDFDQFADALPRFDIYLGDLTSPNLGLDPHARTRLIHSTDSVLHVAASLNRKSSKACLNVNLRGTLAVIQVAKAADEHHGLRRFSDVSTVAVAGHRHRETVTEDACIDWERSDYDPYARTKKFCEHMVHELLPDVPKTIFRPATVLGDSRFPETTQFDMVQAFVGLAYLPVLPLRPEARIDVVPADYVGRAIAHVHIAPNPKYEAYHLSSGEASPTYRQIKTTLQAAGHRASFVFAPRLTNPFGVVVDALTNTPRALGISRHAALMKVFWPYLTFDTVFDNSHTVEEFGEAPVSFLDYAYPLLRFAVESKFTYPYKPWPRDAEERCARSSNVGERTSSEGRTVLRKGPALS